MRILMPASMPRACRKASLRLKAVTTTGDRARHPWNLESNGIVARPQTLWPSCSVVVLHDRKSFTPVTVQRSIRSEDRAHPEFVRVVREVTRE